MCDKKKERLSPLFRLGSQLFLDLGALAHAAAQIVQLGTPHSTIADHLDLVDGGRVHGEDLLHTDTVGDAAHGDGLGDAAVLLGDDGALEDLDTLTGAFRTVSPTLTGVTSASRRSLFSSLIRSMDVPPK